MNEIEPLNLQIEVKKIILLSYKRRLKPFEQPLKDIIKPYLNKQEYFDVLEMVLANICNKIRVQHSTDMHRFMSSGFIADIIKKQIADVNKSDVLKGLQS
jgi:ethanolamine utilization protein EutP (predicted NTPase)